MKQKQQKERLNQEEHTKEETMKPGRKTPSVAALLALGWLVLILCQGLLSRDITGEFSPSGTMELAVNREAFIPGQNFTIFANLSEMGNISIEIDDPAGDPVYLKTLETDSTGHLILNLSSRKKWSLGHYNISAAASTSEGKTSAGTGFELRSRDEFRPDFYLGPSDLFIAPAKFDDWLNSSYTNEEQVLVTEEQLDSLRIFVRVHSRFEVNGSGRLKVYHDSTHPDSLLVWDDFNLTGEETYFFSFPIPAQLLENDSSRLQLVVVIEKMVPPDRNPFDNQLTKTFEIKVMRETNEERTLPFVSPATASAGIIILALAVASFTERGRYPLYFLIFFLYTKLTKKDIETDIVQQSIRGKIFQHIKENPGNSFNEVKRAVDVSARTLSYHVEVLEKFKYIKCENNGTLKHYWIDEFIFPGQKRYRPEGTPPPPSNKQKILIIAMLSKEPLSARQLSNLTGIKVSTVNSQLKKMRIMKMVKKHFRKATMHYTLTEKYDRHFRNYEMKAMKMPEVLEMEG